MSGAYDVFRPRRGRFVALGFAVASPVLFGALALVAPFSGLSGWSLTDSLLLLGFGVLLAAAMWRFAALRATPSPSGIVVRNVLLTSTITWSDVERVRFAGGDPWVILDLSSGEDLAVMAVQKADGAYGRAQAGRLAALAQAHGEGERAGIA